MATQQVEIGETYLIDSGEETWCMTGPRTYDRDEHRQIKQHHHDSHLAKDGSCNGRYGRSGLTRGGLMVAKSQEGWFFSIKSVNRKHGMTMSADAQRQPSHCTEKEILTPGRPLRQGLSRKHQDHISKLTIQSQADIDPNRFTLLALYLSAPGAS
jgi:hypothetical protein